MEKSPSDIKLTTRFSFPFALYLLVKQKENLTLNQGSLSALFCAPLHFWASIDVDIFLAFLSDT